MVTSVPVRPSFRVPSVMAATLPAPAILVIPAAENQHNAARSTAHLPFATNAEHADGCPPSVSFRANRTGTEGATVAGLCDRDANDRAGPGYLRLPPLLSSGRPLGSRNHLGAHGVGHHLPHVDLTGRLRRRAGSEPGGAPGQERARVARLAYRRPAGQ